jgi:hypothetical protein
MLGYWYFGVYRTLQASQVPRVNLQLLTEKEGEVSEIFLLVDYFASFGRQEVPSLFGVQLTMLGAWLVTRDVPEIVYEIGFSPDQELGWVVERAALRQEKLATFQ